MHAFYMTYLTGWWGLGIFLVLAYIAVQVTKRSLRWAYPQYYLDMCRRDEVIVELHGDIAELVGVAFFLLCMMPVLKALPIPPNTALSAVAAFIGTLIVILGIRAVTSALKQLRYLRRPGNEARDEEYWC